MRLLVYSHDICLRHDTGRWHPERPDRIPAAIRGTRAAGVDVEEREAPVATLDQLWAVHLPRYVKGIQDYCSAGGGPLDPDTIVSADSWEASLRAAGSGVAAVDALRNGEGDMAFLAVRPPGHHAEPDRAMGFCVFNNIGIAAEYAAAAGDRVAIVDWDVHHGNATQLFFYDRADVLYVSMHEYPFYPGSGWLDESGTGAGEGYTVNLPFPAGTAGDVYDDAWMRVVVPVLRAHRPDWIMVSAGYDAHADDHLADLRLHEADYGRMARRITEVVGTGRILFFLEGGYDLEAITGSVAATVRGVDGEFPDMTGEASPRRSHHVLDLAVSHHGKYWDLGTPQEG
jgi:acetoin utilization deacetylase AcuC-like enzyme